MKKKLLSLALALVMCMGLAIPALAADSPSEHEIPDGDYILTRQGTGQFVEQQVRTGYGMNQIEYATEHAGYYSLSPDAAWTVKNTPANKTSLLHLSAEYFVPLGGNNFGAGAGFGVLIGKKGFGGNTANGENWEYLDKLDPGDSVTFTLADVLANEKDGIAFLNSQVGREAGETDGVVLIVSVYQQYADSVEYLVDRYCYMIGGEQPGGDDPATTPGFTDVKPGDWFYDAVQWAVENDITSGTSATKFSPNAPCTRGQIATFLWRAAGEPEPISRQMPFTDVAEGSYCEKAVLWAVENDITTGTSATTFSPNAPCNRAQCVTFLWRSQGKTAAVGANPFADVPSGQYYTDPVLWAVEHEITSGTSATTFSPNANCSRAQIVTFLYRCMGE